MRDRSDNGEFRSFAKRVIRAYGKRVSNGDIDALPDLVDLRNQVDAVIRDAVQALRADPDYAPSWTEIGEVLGVSRQAAFQRFGGNGVRKAGGQPAHLR